MKKIAKASLIAAAAFAFGCAAAACDDGTTPGKKPPAQEYAHTVTFTSNDAVPGDGPTSIGVKNSGDEIKLPDNTFTKAGWEFYKWKDTAAGTYHAEKETIKVTKDLEYLAVFYREYAYQIEAANQPDIYVCDDNVVFVSELGGDTSYTYELEADGIAKVTVAAGVYGYYKINDADNTYIDADVLRSEGPFSTYDKAATLSFDGFGKATIGSHTGSYTYDRTTHAVSNLTFEGTTSNTLAVAYEGGKHTVSGAVTFANGDSYSFDEEQGGPQLEGTYTYEGYYDSVGNKYSKFEVDFDTLKVTYYYKRLTNDLSDETNLVRENTNFPEGYDKEEYTYYYVELVGDVTFGLLIKNDGSELLFCDAHDEYLATFHKVVNPTVSVTVSFKLPEGATASGALESKTVDAGTEIDLPTNVSKSGWTLFGWKDADDKYYTDGKYTATRTVILTAVFKKTYSYAEDSWYYGDIDILDDESVYDYYASDDPIPYTVIDGVICYESNGIIIGIRLNDDGTYNVADELWGYSFTADDEETTIVFDGFGKVTLGSHVGTYVVDITPSGWYDIINGATVTFADATSNELEIEYTDDDVFVISGSITFADGTYTFNNAAPEPEFDFTVTFVGPDEGATGTAPDPMGANAGGKVTLPDNPFTKDGWTFYKWRQMDLDPSTNSSAYRVPGGTSNAINKDTTYKAVFQKVYKLTGLYPGNLILLDDGYLIDTDGYFASYTRVGDIVTDQYGYKYKVNDATMTAVEDDGMSFYPAESNEGPQITFNGFGVATINGHTGTYVFDFDSYTITSIEFEGETENTLKFNYTTPTGKLSFGDSEKYTFGDVKDDDDQAEWVEYTGDVELEDYPAVGSIVWVKIDVNGVDSAVTYKVAGAPNTVYTATAKPEYNDGNKLCYSLLDFGPNAVSAPRILLEISADKSKLNIYSSRDSSLLGSLTKGGAIEEPDPEVGKLPVKFEGTYVGKSVADGDSEVVIDGTGTITYVKLDGEVKTAIEVVECNINYGEYSITLKLDGTTFTMTATDGDLIEAISLVSSYPSRVYIDLIRKVEKVEIGEKFYGTYKSDADGGSEVVIGANGVTTFKIKGTTYTSIKVLEYDDEEPYIEIEADGVSFTIGVTDSQENPVQEITVMCYSPMIYVSIARDESGGETPADAKLADFANIEFGFSSLSEAEAASGVVATSDSAKIFKVSFKWSGSEFTISHYRNANAMLSTTSAREDNYGNTITDQNYAGLAISFKYGGKTISLHFKVIDGKKAVTVYLEGVETATWYEIA
ncbi:MAG: InlB B-repeat-containing protein [Clostridiales bacterium]|nr:InlB B-repeat-containing protein [Clostridiales bacterium]